MWLEAWRTFLGDLDDQGQLDWREVFADGTFAGPKKGALVGKTKRGKGTKLLVVADGQGVPLGVELASASPHEATLIEPLLAQIHVPRMGPGRPRCRFPRLIYDRAADSEPLRDRLAQRGIDLICPHRINRIKPKRQDGRKLACMMITLRQF